MSDTPTASTTQEEDKKILAGLDKLLRALNVLKGVAKLLGCTGLQEIEASLKETRGTLGNDSAGWEGTASLAELVITVTQQLVPEARREEYWNLIKDRLMSIEQAVESFMREVLNRIEDTAIPWLSGVTAQLCDFTRSVIERSLGEATRLILGTRSYLMKDSLCIEAKSGATKARPQTCKKPCKPKTGNTAKPPVKPKPKIKGNTVKPPIKPKPQPQAAAQKLVMKGASSEAQMCRQRPARRGAMIQELVRQLHLD
eukprot:m.7242 g.7242  ORF g.7242 m.7242 type:complete len:256 (+) comp8759_c0_seq2:91-858(+)